MMNMLLIGCLLSYFCIGEVLSYGSDINVSFKLTESRTSSQIPGLDNFAVSFPQFSDENAQKSGSDFFYPVWNPQYNVCEPAPLGRVPWILHVRKPDYGWDEHTHRANIALAVNKYMGDSEEMSKMELQLQVEVTKALFRNASSPIHENELALFIHALIATNKNPRDFHGVDLVADLLHRVESMQQKQRAVHPFLVLALCNSHAVTQEHLESIKGFAEHDHESPDHDGRKTELKALALKAYACAASLDRNLAKFPKEMENAAKCLIRRQNELRDGSFGNVYTTSLAVQALTATDRYVWNEKAALEFLEKEAYNQTNLIRAYYIEMALNARSVNFIKDLYHGTFAPPEEPPAPRTHYITYTIQEGHRPEHYFTVTMLVEPYMTFFDIMVKAKQLSDNFSFDYNRNHENLPMVHRVAGTPNDAEENMFWRICRQSAVDHQLHTARIEEHHGSPMQFIPEKEEHVVLRYINRNC